MSAVPSAPPATQNAIPQRPAFKLTEDWLATFIGLAVVIIISLGVFGPGGETAALNAPTGETKKLEVRPLSGWSVSATLNGTKLTVSLPKALEGGRVYQFVCENGAITEAAADTPLPEGITAPASGRALLVLVNRCDEAAVLTYTYPASIPWPVFRIF